MRFTPQRRVRDRKMVRPELALKLEASVAEFCGRLRDTSIKHTLRGAAGVKTAEAWFCTEHGGSFRLLALSCARNQQKILRFTN